MRRQLTLKWLLPLGLATVLLLITGLSTLNSLLDTKAQLVSASRADLLNHTAHLARMVEQGLQSSRSLVEADVGHASTDQRVTAVLILDHTGRILLVHRRAWHGQLAAEKMPGFDDTWQAAKYDAIMARLPSLAAVLLVLLGVAWLLQRQVARPLARLGRAASALAQGHLDTRVVVSGPAEIAALSADFNAMSSALQHNQATLAANEKRLAITLHAIGDGLIATDAQGSSA